MPRLGSFVGDHPRDLRYFNVVLTNQAPSETATGADHMECDVGVLNPGRNRGILKTRNLAGRPDLQFAVLEPRRGILRLQWSVGEQWEFVLGFHNLGGILEGRFNVAILSAPRAAARGSFRGLVLELLDLSHVTRAALRSNRTLVPLNL